jgi:hypothetical protein
VLRKKQPNSLVDVAEEPREQITIAKDVPVMINIVRTILLAATMRKYPKII